MISLAKIVLSDKTEMKNMPFFDKTETKNHPFLDKTEMNKSLFPYSPKNPLLYLLTFNFFCNFAARFKLQKITSNIQ